MYYGHTKSHINQKYKNTESKRPWGIPVVQSSVTKSKGLNTKILVSKIKKNRVPEAYLEIGFNFTCKYESLLMSFLLTAVVKWKKKCIQKLSLWV